MFKKILGLLFIILFLISSPLNAELMVDGKLKGNFGIVDATTVNANATAPTELITWTDAGWDEDGVTWTFAGGVLTHVTGNVTAVTSTLGVAIEVGKTYQVGFTGTGGTATATYTLGGVTGTTIPASGAIAITDYITAATTGVLIITPSNTCTVALTLVSVKALTDATGDLTIDGNATFRSPVSIPIGNYLITSYGDGSFLPIRIGALGNQGFYADSAGNVYTANAGSSRIAVTTSSLYLFGGIKLSFANNAYLLADAAAVLACRNSTTAQAFRLYTTYVSGTSYERLGINTAAGSITLAAETLDAGTDNVDIVLTPAGTGQLKNTAANITVGATGTSVSTGHLNRQVYVRTYAAADFTDTDTTKGIVIATLPAKTKIVGFYADSTATFKGGTVNAATLEVGITSEGAAEILAPLDIWTATATYGLADANMGTGMTRAAAIQGGYLPSWTGTTAIYATIDTTAGNLNALTTGSVTFYIVTERF